MKKTLIVGGGGRESAIAGKLAENASIYAVMPHINPTIKHYVEKTGGSLLIASPSDVDAVTEFALTQQIDLAFVSADDPLASGVVDALLNAGIRAVGPTRNGAQIEWDKTYAMRLMRRLFPEYTPGYWSVNNEASLMQAIDEIKSSRIDIVVKPQGLTGGKGVKVMGAHLSDLDEAIEYARELLWDRPQESVILMEKVAGIEFTIMAITDGVSVLTPPATYDYPYRFDGDTGPGTGGMGSFTGIGEPLPFMTQHQYDQCIDVVKGVLKAMKQEGRHFNGVLNAGFFVTDNGIKFLEFNARFGDPECMNIMTVLDTSLLSLLESIEQGSLVDKPALFADKASVVKYLVTPEYALKPGIRHAFTLDVAALNAMGIDVYFSSATYDNHQADGSYITVGNSRCVALAASGDSIPQAGELIEMGIRGHVSGPLQWRTDIGSADYINRLKVPE